MVSMKTMMNEFRKTEKLALFAGLDGVMYVTDGKTGFSTDAAMAPAGYAVLQPAEWYKDGRVAELAEVVAAGVASIKTEGVSEGLAALRAALEDLRQAADDGDLQSKTAGALRGAQIRVVGGQVKLIGSTGAVLSAVKCGACDKTALIPVIELKQLAVAAGARVETIKFGVFGSVVVAGVLTPDGQRAFRVLPLETQPREEPKKAPRPEVKAPDAAEKTADANAAEKPAEAKTAWEYADLLLELEKVQTALSGLRTAVKTMAKEKAAAEKDTKTLVELVKRLGGSVK
jgi:hypothetical protein